MKHNPEIVKAFFQQYGIPHPVFEYRFCPERRWRFDMAWSWKHLGDEYPEVKVACEVQGGIFVSGRHSRGAALLKEWEKLNTAAEMGWRIIYCQPSELLTKKTADTIRKCLGLD